MFASASRALSQMLSPPFRSVLLRSMGLALAFLVVAGIGLHRLLSWGLGEGGVWLETTIGPNASTPVNVMEWVLAFAAGLGIFAGAIFLMPAVTALVAGFFADEIAEEVERRHYPADPPGRALPLPRAVLEGAKTAALSLLIYLLALPFLFFAGLGLLIFFFANAFLLGREYFEMAAMRFHPPQQARALRRRHAGTVFLAGMMISAFVSVPILNLATPLFATALMVHLHKRLLGGTRELILPDAEGGPGRAIPG